MLRTALLAAAAAMILVGCEDSSSRAQAQATPIDTAGMISLIEAVTVAHKAVPDGFAIEAELEMEDDEGEPPAWEVLLYVGADGRLIEVEVHAYTGAVLELEVESEGEGDEGDGDDGDGDDGDGDDD